MSTTTITKKFYYDGVLTTPDTSYTIAVTRSDTGATVVETTSMTEAGTGTLTHTFTDPAFGLTYNYTIVLTHSGEVYTFTGSTTGSVGTEPITLAEAKLHLRVDGSDEDDLITSLIIAARQVCEADTWRGLVASTLVDKYDTWPCDNKFRLRKPPLRSVSSITYVDTNGDTQTLSTDVYDVDTTSEPGQINLAYNQSWPSIRSQHHAITITYSAGYASSSAVPDSIKAAMKLLIGTWYENRESVVVGTRLEPTMLPAAVLALLSTNSVEHFW